MTNYNKRLDEIFAPLIDSPSLTLTTTYWCGAKQAILDWHNKQVEQSVREALDRINLSMRGKAIVDTAEGWQAYVKEHIVEAIEAERNNLKEANQ